MDSNTKKLVGQWESKLIDLSKMKMNIELQFVLLKNLWECLNEAQQTTKSKIFQIAFSKLSAQIKQLTLYELVSISIWQYQNTPLQLRDKTRPFAIISAWVVSFELDRQHLKTNLHKLKWFNDFIIKNTNTMLECAILFEQIWYDLCQFYPFILCNDPTLSNAKRVFSEQTHDEVQQLLAMLKHLNFRQIITIGKQKAIYKLNTYPKAELTRLKQFIEKALLYILGINGLNANIQIEVTQLCLCFLMGIHSSQTIIHMVKTLMVRTDKAVRYSLMFEYVQYYQIVEKIGNLMVMSELEELMYFRELIINNQTVDQSELKQERLLSPQETLKELQLKAGAKERLYFSNWQTDNCVLRLEFYLSGWDINVKLLHLHNGKESKYWEQAFSKGKKVQVILEFEGLYCLQFDNSFSWVHAKTIKYRYELYTPLQ